MLADSDSESEAVVACAVKEAGGTVEEQLMAGLLIQSWAKKVVILV